MTPVRSSAITRGSRRQYWMLLKSFLSRPWSFSGDRAHALAIIEVITGEPKNTFCECVLKMSSILDQSNR